ncbi:MAG: hypothetical protein ACRDRX_28070 [Pseudonocardiaceae bacterium]
MPMFWYGPAQQTGDCPVAGEPLQCLDFRRLAEGAPLGAGNAGLLRSVVSILPDLAAGLR